MSRSNISQPVLVSASLCSLQSDFDVILRKENLKKELNGDVKFFCISVALGFFVLKHFWPNLFDLILVYLISRS